MDEKILHEYRVIETEDGFRIEIKGDKEKLRKVVDRISMRLGGGGRPEGKRGGHGRHGKRGRRFGRHGRWSMGMHMHGGRRGRHRDADAENAQKA